MKPRTQPPPGTPPDMPLRLQHFDPDDWEVGPVPEWWTDADYDPLMWAPFKARLTYMRAKRDWLREHGYPPYPAA